MYKEKCVLLVLLCTFLVFAGCSESSSDSRASTWLGVGAQDTSTDLYRLSISAVNFTVGAGQKIPLLMRLTTFGDAPVKETSISMTSSSGGSFEGDSQTDVSGYYHQTFTAGNDAGTILITATAKGAIATLSLQVQPQSVDLAQVSVFVASETIKPDANMPIQVYVANESGVAVDTNVYLSTAAGGTFADDSGLTVDGWFATTFTAASAVGQETITALSLGQTGSKTISVRE